MTLKIGGETIIERCIGAFSPFCAKIIVVTGKYHEDIKQCLFRYPGVCIVYNENFAQGMFGSVKEGVKHVEAERFFITPGDYPFLEAKTIYSLINIAEPFVVPVYKGQQGHPVLLDKQFVSDILNSACPSLRDCLLDIPTKRQEVHVDDAGVVTDIDTAEEYRSAVQGR